jgi:phage terminase small subunit
MEMLEVKSRNYQKSNLTPAKKKFAEVYAKTDNATLATKQAYPDTTDEMSDITIRNKAHRLLNNDSVSAEIQYQKDKLERLASRAVNRVERLIDSDNESIATTNSWKTIEQVQGRATQRVEQTTTGITLNIDLTSALLEETTD